MSNDNFSVQLYWWFAILEAKVVDMRLYYVGEFHFVYQRYGKTWLTLIIAFCRVKIYSTEYRKKIYKNTKLCGF